MNKDIETKLESLQKENNYLKKITESLTARILKNNCQSTNIRHELEYKRRGFKLMNELAINMSMQQTEYESVIASVSMRINTALNMQRTVILMPDAETGYFRIYIMHGYSAEDKAEISVKRIHIDSAFLKTPVPTIVTGNDPDSLLQELRENIKLPYLILSPVILYNDLTAVLITGRIIEQNPWMLRLNKSDAETVQAVSAYLAAMFTGHRLQEAEHAASRDPLTQLPNLRSTEEVMKKIIEMARRDNSMAAVMFVDLDRFKIINDTCGHQVGDQVLITVANRMMSSVRESDLVGRIGGDEFIICLPRIFYRKEASLVAEKVMKKIIEPMQINNNSFEVTVSIGISMFPEHGKTWGELVKAADQAMYVIKNSGKNFFGFAD